MRTLPVAPITCGLLVIANPSRPEAWGDVRPFNPPPRTHHQNSTRSFFFLCAFWSFGIFCLAWVSDLSACPLPEAAPGTSISPSHPSLGANSNFNKLRLCHFSFRKAVPSENARNYSKPSRKASTIVFGSPTRSSCIQPCMTSASLHCRPAPCPRGGTRGSDSSSRYKLNRYSGLQDNYRKINGPDVFKQAAEHAIGKLLVHARLDGRSDIDVLAIRGLSKERL